MRVKSVLVLCLVASASSRADRIFTFDVVRAAAAAEVGTISADSKEDQSLIECRVRHNPNHIDLPFLHQPTHTNTNRYRFTQPRMS